MKFSEALERCIGGAKITRRDWNGKGMFVYYVGPSVVYAENWAPWKSDTAVEVRGHFDMLCADGTVCVGWLATQTDMASDRWEEV